MATYSNTLKGVAVAAAVSLGAFALAPQAQARNDDLPALIAGLAIGAIIAHQATKRHRHHYDQYTNYPYSYVSPRHRRDYRHGEGGRHWNRHYHRHHH